MTVLRYCERVQEQLSERTFVPTDGRKYCEDAGLASRAVTLALEGDDDAALELAEAIAERWHLLV